MMVASAPSPTPKRRIVEFCCGRNSRIGQLNENAEGCEVVRLTIDDDVTTPEGLKKAIKAVSVTGMPVLLWASIPCTGGSPWARVNATKGASTRKLLAKRVRDFKNIWRAFESVVAVAAQRGAIITIEWPRECAYWSYREVKRLMARHSFVTSDFDGCQYGLVSKAPKTRGKPIKKPWRLASTSRKLLHLWSRAC